MYKSLVAAGFIAAACIGATSAGAVPLAGTAAPSVEGSIVLVHGDHRACERGANGWHRHNWRGVRLDCRPPRPGLRYWIWRSEGGRTGWWHSRDRRWQ